MAKTSSIRSALKKVFSPFHRNPGRSTVVAYKFRSKFGGLWTDAPEAPEIIAQKLSKGVISPLQAEQLECWIENGYVVLPRAVEPSIVDAVLADVDSIYAGALGKCFVETWESGKLELIPVKSRHKTVQHKLLDIYSASDAARKAQLSLAIADFLKLIFGRPALAFQSLYFQLGSEQALHQDSAFVKVNSPMELAASWIALEDIQAGSGELQYVPKSHTIDEYLFEGKSKWMPDHSAEYQAFIEHVAATCNRRGLPTQNFIAKKGDAFIWSADLAHGGSKITRPGMSRKSLVTHYCPVDIDPHYFAYPHSDKIKLPNGHFVAFALR